MPKTPRANMLKEEVVWIFQHLQEDMEVFEWGAGQSTILFSQWCKRYVSVEQNLQWFLKVERALVTNNVDLIYEPEERRHPGIIDAQHQKFDFVLVDGGPRNQCAHYALDNLKPDGVLLFHDWDRDGGSLFSRSTKRWKSLEPWES